MDWVVERGVFEETEPELIRILGERLIWCKYTTKGPIFTKGEQEVNIDPLNDRFIFYGSIHVGRALQRSHNCTCWLYDHVYDCNHYLPKFHKFALNNPHIFVEAGGFAQLRDYVLDGVQFFVKENCGYKHFTGGVYEPAFQDEIDKLFDDELLLLAPAKQIGAEWRFVISTSCLSDEVSPHKIVTYSQYGEKTSDKDPSDFVREVLSDPHVRSYDPAPVWTLDVCSTDGGFFVVEINSLLSAGWYFGSAEAIIGAVDEAIQQL